MKLGSVFSNFVLGTSCAFSSAVFADVAAERDAILKQAGCFDVTYQFDESNVLENYPFKSSPYKNASTEYVALETNEQNQIVLQHILSIGPSFMIKHFSQDWRYEPKEAIAFKGKSSWLTSEVNGQGKWSQTITDIVDAPRYGCVAAWADTRSNGLSWQCQTWSPLPRREYKDNKRSDYDVLLRTDNVFATATGWTQEEANSKEKLADGQLSRVALDNGFNKYTRVDDSKCEAAKKWWNERRAVWADVRAMWNHIQEHHKDIKLIDKVNDQLLSTRLNNVVTEELKVENRTDESRQKFLKVVHDLIHEHFAE